MGKIILMLRVVALCFGVVGLAHSNQAVAADLQGDPDTNSAKSSMAQSFAQVANLNREIEFQSRILKEKQLKKQLADMERDDEQASLGFKVARIEGFGEKFYSVILFDNGAVTKVFPGDKIADKYLVSMMKPDQIVVVDIKSHHAYTVPFVRAYDNKKSPSSNDNQVKIIGPAVEHSATPKLGSE